LTDAAATVTFRTDRLAREGAMKWRGRRGSDNIADVRGGGGPPGGGPRRAGGVGLLGMIVVLVAGL
jgi:hypothetical protein